MKALNPINNGATPRTRIIEDNIRIAISADGQEQSIAHRDEAVREIEQLERELAAVTAETAELRIELRMEQLHNGKVQLRAESAEAERDAARADFEGMKPHHATAMVKACDQKDRLSRYRRNHRGGIKMTPAEIKALDEWIAENIFKIVPFSVQLPRYSTDPAASMAVLEKCINKASQITITSPLINDMDWISASDASVPLAICLFAKKLFTK